MNAHIIMVGTDTVLEQQLKNIGTRVDRLSLEQFGALTSPITPAPDVLLVDRRGEPQPPGAMLAFKRQHPTTAIILVAKALDNAVLLDAMRSGVSECLAEPVTDSDLETAIGRALGLRASSTKVLAFVGAKGGVGTTTTAVNVAAALARMSVGDVLLIDLHIGYGDAAVFLGANPRFSVLDALENAHRLDEAVLAGLVVKTAGFDLLAAANRLPRNSSGATDVRALLALAARRYAYTILDVPRGDRIVLDSLDIVTTIVVLANQDLATIRSAHHLTGELQQRYGADRVAVVLAREDQRADIDRADIEEAIGRKIRYVLPSDYRATVAALNRGQPLVCDGENALADAFVGLASNLANLKTPSHASGFLHRVVGHLS